MEEKNGQYTNEGNVSDAVFGTSSDAIIDGLHQGMLAAQSFTDAGPETGGNDKNQIVNAQDQNDITNGLENDDFSQLTPGSAAQAPTDDAPLMSKREANAILRESDHLDEAGDSEKGVTPQNLENDKIN